MATKENFFDYSTKFIILITRITLGNVDMIAIDMCQKKKPSRRSGYIELCEKLPVYFYVFYLFVYLLNYLIIFDLIIV